MSSTTYEKKASIKNGLGRMMFSVLVLLLEAIFIIFVFLKLNDYAIWIIGVHLFAIFYLIFLWSAACIFFEGSIKIWKIIISATDCNIFNRSV